MVTPLSRIALHEQIARSLREQLLTQYTSGDRFPSQNELAARFAVSPNTTREAVALLVQEGLLERRFGSGTYVTERRPETCIAIVTELDITHPDLSPFWPDLIQALRQRFAGHGWMTRLYVGHAPPFGEEPPAITSLEFKHDLAANRIAGIALVSASTRLLTNVLAGRSIPCVDCGHPGGVPVIDYHELVRRGVDALAERGCRRVACLALTAGTATSTLLDFAAAEVRRAGLQTEAGWMRGASFGHAPELAPLTVFRQLWHCRPEPPDGLLVLDDMLYRAIAPMLLYNRLHLPANLVLVSHRNRRDTRPLSPAPIGLTVDPTAAGHAVADYLCATLRDRQARPAGVPIPIAIDEPAHAALAFTSS